MLASTNDVCANDTAASTAAGGLRLTREARISMEKERLTISENLVRVEYEFLNDTDTSITTEVAFPIPDYEFEVDDVARTFDHFRLWVDGAEVKYDTESRAICSGADCTAALRQFGIDIVSFGHFDWKKMASNDVLALPADKQAKLVKLGLIDAESKFPCWSVRKTYHWMQTFPVKRPLHIAHEYRPVKGFAPVLTTDLKTSVLQKSVADAQQALTHDSNDSSANWSFWIAEQIQKACIEPALQSRIHSEALANNEKTHLYEEGTAYVELVWVDYILTTANNWKTPIKDFELFIQRPKAEADHRWYVSFCWDGPIEQPEPNLFRAHITDFVPTHELRVTFIEL